VTSAPLLDLRFESCVRSLSVWSHCTACVDACPEAAITGDGAHRSIVVDLDRCTDCGACSAACPTDAFTAPYDVDAFVSTTGPRLRCGQDGLPCVGAVATEDLLVIALRHGDVTVEDGPCAFPGAAHAAVPGRGAEVNAFLAAMGLPGSVRVEAVESAPAESAPKAGASRRALFFGGVEERPPRGQLTQPKRLDKDNLQYTQDRRWRLLAYLPADVKPVQDTVPGETFTFLSSKVFEPERCTLCTICVRICPTGALTAGRNFKDLAFDTSQCVRCGLCHDVCQTDAILLSDQTSLARLVTRKDHLLGSIPSRKCVECGMAYNAAVNPDGLCPRCASLEQEAIALSTVRR
jgi:energy-converting hydrogenase A subunit P